VRGVVVAAFVFVIACVKSAPPNTAPTPPTASEAVAQVDLVAGRCAKIASCAHSHDAPRERDPGACVDWWITHVKRSIAPFARCIDTAASCAAIDACLLERVGNATAAAFCRAHPGEQTACDHDHLITCAEDDPAESTVTDCRSVQGTCGENRVGGLITRGCLSPALCPAGAPEARCDGESAIVSCRDGSVERTACAPGVRCEQQKTTDGVEAALCEPPGHAHCRDIGKSRCDGSRLVQCAPHGHLGEQRVQDCGALGLACDESAGRAWCAVPGVRGCEAGTPRCAGEALQFCAAGHVARVSCTALGFGACDPDAHGLEAACAVK
jgi:hypothetical protein